MLRLQATKDRKRDVVNCCMSSSDPISRGVERRLSASLDSLLKVPKTGAIGLRFESPLASGMVRVMMQALIDDLKYYLIIVRLSTILIICASLSLQ